jgi:hypothetical protein
MLTNTAVTTSPVISTLATAISMLFLLKRLLAGFALSSETCAFKKLVFGERSNVFFACLILF